MLNVGLNAVPDPEPEPHIRPHQTRTYPWSAIGDYPRRFDLLERLPEPSPDTG